MPTGWFVREPPSVGTIATSLKKRSMSAQGNQPEYGPLYSQLKKQTAAMSGRVDPAGGIAVSLKKRTMTAVGLQTQQGTMGASTKKPTFYSTPLATGTMQASVKKTATVMNGNQPFTGVVGASLKKALATISGTQRQAGTLAGSTKKVTAQLRGAPSIISNISATFTSNRTISTGTLPSYTPAEGDIVFVYAHIIQTNIPATFTMPSGWVLVGNVTSTNAGATDLVVYHVVTAAEAAAVTTSWTLTNIQDVAKAGRRMAYVVRNANSSSPVDKSAFNSGNSNSVVVPAITPDYNNSLVVAGFGGNAGSTTDTFTQPSGWTFVDGSMSASNSAAALQLKNGLSQAGVAIPTFNVAINRVDDWSCHIMAIRAA